MSEYVDGDAGMEKSRYGAIKVVSSMMVCLSLMLIGGCSSGGESTGAAKSGGSASTSATTNPSPSESSPSVSSPTETEKPVTDSLGTYYDVIKDRTLAECVASEMWAKPTDQLSKKKAESVTDLTVIGVLNEYNMPDTLPSCGIALKHLTNLSGLEVFTNLKIICLDHLTNLSDISALRGMSKLAIVSLKDTAVRDLTPLGAVKHVRTRDDRGVSVYVTHAMYDSMIVPKNSDIILWKQG
ncbi:hypothetical protein GFD17_07900 [Bifidobacterium sp. SMB2]|nr:hypothetical protein [Bifidobacterium saimiriisciurei]NEG96673.1 hypothetical protein [Bifidobacterium sp. SMB2]NEH11829.1 hypothetical protein [Bifidobacterium saimiriisciurei]